MQQFTILTNMISLLHVHHFNSMCDAGGQETMFVITVAHQHFVHKCYDD